jgi:YggT family protein
VIVLITVIRYVANILTLIVFIDILVSYFLSPYHSIRRILDTIVRPMLDPIRRIMPRTGMIDFSPLVLIILIQVVEVIIIRIIEAFL